MDRAQTNRRMIRKLAEYRDVALLAEIIALQAEVSRGGGTAALDILNRPVKRGRRLGRDEIDRYVNFGLRLGGMFGLVNSCLPRSVIRCVLLNRSGVPARVAFGLNKKGGALDGHCWVVEDGAPPPDDPAARFKHVEIYPEELP